MRPSSDKNTPESFTDIQYRFTRHIRDPDASPPPDDVEERRMAIYRDLLYRNVESFLANSFPVLRKILKDDEWHTLMRSYFRERRARTPLFPRMPQEFLQYLQDERESGERLYPFIEELAHYEWVELALSIDVREIRQDGIEEEGDLLSGVPVINELSFLLAYDYPVHRISPDYLPAEKPEQTTFLIAYRDRQDQVRFIELNPVTARLVDYLKENEDEKTGMDILNQVAHEIAHRRPQVVVRRGHGILEDLRKKQVVLGAKEVVS